MPNPKSSGVEDMIDSEIARGDNSIIEPKNRTKREPTYRVVGNSRVPVSKAHGKLWQSRRDQAKSHRKRTNIDRAWDEALRYYRNDQMQHRYDNDSDGDYIGNEANAAKLGRNHSETENIVFANTSALVPTLYAKNPSAEFTANDPADEEMVTTLEKLVARIMSKRSAPGVNLKPKVRKAVVMTTLANAAYAEVGYTFREQSSDAALEDIAKLSMELGNAKTPQQVEIIEGKLAALEETISVLRPAGPWVKYRRPQDVIFDTDAIEDDHSDGKWMMVADFINTMYLNARFAHREGTTLTSVYKPSHVLRRGDGGNAGHNAAEQEINNYTLFAEDGDGKPTTANDYGYDDEDTFNKACRTKCWWIWDRTTQRCLLYADKDWSWPIWVWDDPYHLQGFFPIYKLQFYTDPEQPMSKGEVTYYLDQQDSINQINSEFKQARQWARRNLFYDKSKVSKDEVEKFIKGDEDVAVGVDVPDGMTLKDMVQTVLPPSMQFIQLFDKAPILEAIDRISSVQPVMRGVEFKTNTTNQAINQYNSVQQTRTDEKIDAVEDFIGQIAWALAQMCLQFMPQDEVAMLIGDLNAQKWVQMDAPTIARKLQMTVVGGSTQKPTSESKKQQALNMGQVLGQFVNAAPIPVLMVMLNTMRQAFNDVIPDEDWRMVMEQVSGMAALPTETAAVAASGTADGDAAGAGAQPDPVAAFEQLLSQLPPEAQKALGVAISRGVPVSEALTRIMQLMQGGANGGGAPAPAQAPQPAPAEARQPVPA